MAQGLRAIDRHSLIFKYTYLVLPPTLPAGGIHTTMMLGNYEAVKAIALGTSGLPLNLQQGIITSFFPSTPVDVSFLSAVPLRLRASCKIQQK